MADNDEPLTQAEIDRLASSYEKAEEDEASMMALAVDLQARTDASARSRSFRCCFCNHAFFWLEHDHALVAGHVYSDAGREEVRITGVCEWCFDEVTKETEDPEDDTDSGRMFTLPEDNDTE
jgi:hypothetical protein